MITEITSVWQGSVRTAHDIASQIAHRYGDDEVKNYHPEINCFTYNGWRQRGFKVKRGEKALRSITFHRTSVTEKDKSGKDVRKFASFPKSVCLFYVKQVEPIKGNENAELV